MRFKEGELIVRKSWKCDFNCEGNVDDIELKKNWINKGVCEMGKIGIWGFRSGLIK